MIMASFTVKPFADVFFHYFKKRYELSDPDDSWAEKAKEEMLKIKPEYESWVLNFEAERFKQAIAEQNRQNLFEQTLRSQQYLERGLELRQKGELEKALIEFNRALSLTPDNPKVVAARQQVIKDLTEKTITERSELAIKKIQAGDSYSAKREIENILSTIPGEPIFTP